MLSDRQRLHWLRLIRTENVGPASFRGLINRFGSAEAALAVLPELALAGGARRPSRIPSEAEAEQEMEAARRFGARFAAIGEPDYPPMLRCMELPPPLVAIKGNAALFQPPAAAVVGARNASAAGTRMARMLAAGLGGAGFVVVSGLARGIDAAAHEGSLATGTVAVLAGGLDRPYPPENIALAERIAAEGVLISEMPFGRAPRARDFPRRNRLVAGLGLGLVVVEAAQRSGSLISARLAGEMGRLVFAVPGSPLDPRAAGANGLIKDGATLVTQAQDVVEAGSRRCCRWRRPRTSPPCRLQRKASAPSCWRRSAPRRYKPTNSCAIRAFIRRNSRRCYWNLILPGAWNGMPEARSRFSLPTRSGRSPRTMSLTST